MKTNKQTKSYKWAYLPFIFSSAAILANSAIAAPSASQQYQDAKQVNSVNHEYVGGNTQLGVSVTDQGNVGLELNQVLSEDQNSSTSAGLWADYDLDGDDKGIQGRGVQVNHNWVSRDKAGRATHVNKVTAAYDRNASGHDKATVGYGQENENLFWDVHASKGLSGSKNSRKVGARTVSDKAYDYGVGAGVGTFLKDSNMRVRAGLDHEWGDDVGVGESTAKNTTLSAGIEKFFQGTPHSLALDVAASKKSGGYNVGSDDSDVNGRLTYRYDFGGASIYQPDRRYKRVRVEVPGKAIAPRYKSVPTYTKKTVKKPYKQLVKSTVALEGQTFFKLNSAKLIPSAQARLKQIATEIRKNGYKGSIRITGNTCGLGDPVYDQKLSEQRARAVRAFLIKNGFNANHLMARGLGKAHPKFPNTPEQGFKNRRVDIEYVSERKAYKTGYRTETQNVRTGSKQVLVSTGKPGTPRVIWRTEVIPTSPAWIKRALHNNIRHDRNVNTYTSTDDAPIAPVNNAPVANNDSDKISCGTGARVISLVGNDTDADGDALTITNIDQPKYGTAVINDDKTSITYTPNSDGSGCGKTDTFNYTVSDGKDTDTATVSVMIDAPVDNNVDATDDSRSMDQDSTILIDVLNNDDSDASIKRIVRAPSNGTAVIENGQIRYKPNAGYTGMDTFDYEVTDPQGNLAIATVTINIKKVDTPVLPEANDDSVTLETCSMTTINVLENDNQGSGNATVAVTSAPSNGSTVVLADGSIKYTPDDDYVGADSFQYTITDSKGNTSTATVSITVTNQCQGGNAEPVAVNDSAIAHCDAVSIDVLGNDTDPDGDALSIIGVSDPSLGTVTYKGNNVVYTPVNSCGTGMDTFSYTISDGHGHTATAKIMVDVKGCEATDSCGTGPDAINVVNDTASTKEDKGIMIDVLSNDDKGLMIVGVKHSGNAYVEEVNGKISYLPAKGFSGKDTFTYTVKDAHGQTAQATVTVSVKKAIQVNLGPDAVEDAILATVGKSMLIDVLANDTDPENDKLTIDSIIGAGGGAMPGGVAKIENGKIRFTSNGTVGSYGFYYAISDGHGGVDVAGLSIGVTDPNDGNDNYPNIKDETVTTSKGVSILVDVLANDFDDDGDVLILDQISGADNGTIVKEGKKVRYTPNPGFVGTDNFWYGVHDSHGHSISGQTTVIVTD